MRPENLFLKMEKGTHARPARADHDAQTGRHKSLAVQIFGRTRELGVFPSKLHTDILSVRSPPCAQHMARAVHSAATAGVSHDSTQPAD